jgi:hypothetical protein
MEPTSSTPDHTLLEELRRRRAELLESMSAVEQALAAPAPGREPRWAERVHVALVELSADFGEHIDITEGPDGLYRELLSRAPRLSGAVTRLTGEHARIGELINELLACVGESELNQDVETVRDRGTVLLAKLAGHRQRGSDLIYEAYASDIGGET